MSTPPILFMIFRRPENTARVFEAIRAARPSQLYVAADGPRADCPDDAAKCAEARAVVGRVDWPCEVHTRFRERNMGCGLAVHDALRWFFENVESGVILEDDVLPEPTFFPYCAELLERHRDDPGVMMISGYNPLDRRVGDGDYYASAMAQIWGWATWRRAIAHFDFRLETYPAFRDADRLRETMSSRLQRNYFANEIGHYHDRRITANWDLQWFYSCLNQRGACLIPCTNLVRNIGFGADSTFAANPFSYHARRKTAPMPLPPKAPSSLKPDMKADREILGRASGLTYAHQFLVRCAQPFAGVLLKAMQRLREVV